MKRKLVLLLCTVMPLVLSTAAKPPVEHQCAMSAAMSSLPFELPSNLPTVEAIHPLNDAAKARLRANGFVVLPDQDIERLSDAYMRLFGEERVSVLITTDVALHLFHNVLDDLLAEVEKAHLTADVHRQVEDLYTASVAHYEAIPDTQAALYCLIMSSQRRASTCRKCWTTTLPNSTPATTTLSTSLAAITRAMRAWSVTFGL